MFIDKINRDFYDFSDIQRRWVSVHFRIHLFSFLVAFASELIVFLSMYVSGDIYIPISIYLVKYLITPVGINALCVLVSYLALKQRTISMTTQVYTISISFLVTCAVIYFIHSYFHSMLLVFAFPVLLTLIYGSYPLTISISGMSLTLYILSELCFVWDHDKDSIFDSSDNYYNFVLSIVLLICLDVAMLSAAYFSKLKNQTILERDQEKARLLHKLKIDSLTGLYNKAALMDALEKACDSAQSSESRVLAMLDVDYFKELNDTQGHPAGDIYLQLIGGALKGAGPNARAFRFGGDEFCILFRDISIEEAENICTNLQERIFRIDYVVSDRKPTLSIGLAARAHNMSADAFLSAADKALYRAKKSRNCICIAS